MPRSVRTRESDGGPPEPAAAVRRQWLTKWKTWAVTRLPGDAEQAAKVQLRVDVERALARYRIDDDDAEIRDVVTTLVEETTARLATERDKHHHEARRKTVIALASVYLGVGLNKSDRGAVATMLKRSGFTFAQLTARLQRYLDRHLRGDEDDHDVQRMVDAWTARRLAEQPAASGGFLGTALAAAGAVVTGAVAASQHPVVKAAINQGLEKVKQRIQQWRRSPPPEGSKPS